MVTKATIPDSSSATAIEASRRTVFLIPITFFSGAERGRTHSAFGTSNSSNILLWEGNVCAPGHKVRQSTKKRRTSENAQKTKFAEFIF